jgi:hypothetical protein
MKTAIYSQVLGVGDRVPGFEQPDTRHLTLLC